jgi:hypothetical protein
MKAIALALALSCLALSGFSQTRVDITAVLTKDFIDSPSLDQAASALGGQQLLVGLGWEVVMDHIGIGGSYAVDFHEDSPAEWWLDWEAQAIYCSYHILGSRSLIDPFVDAGLACAGRVFLGPSGAPAERLALAIYPFASAGAALELNGLRAGAKLSYALSQGAIPATSIPAYPLGRFQVSAFAGISLGAR